MDDRPPLKTVFPAVFLVGSYLILSALVIVAVRAAALRPAETLPVQEVLLPWQSLAFIVAGFFVAALIVRKLKARMAWELILGITLFLGAWFYAWVAFSGEVGLLVASVLTLLQAFVRRVWSHNVFMLVGVSGVALNFAFLFPSHTMLILLVGMAVYDTFAGRPGGLIAQFAASLVHRGIIPGLIIPGNLAQLGSSVTESVRQPQTMFLGAGDLILPLMLVGRAAGAGFIYGLGVALGAVLAAAWIGYRGATHPIPALVPFAIGTGIPYLSFVLLHYV